MNSVMIQTSLQLGMKIIIAFIFNEKLFKQKTWQFNLTVHNLETTNYLVGQSYKTLWTWDYKGVYKGRKN